MRLDILVLKQPTTFNVYSTVHPSPSNLGMSASTHKILAFKQKLNHAPNCQSSAIRLLKLRQQPSSHLRLIRFPTAAESFFQNSNGQSR